MDTTNIHENLKVAIIKNNIVVNIVLINQNNLTDVIDSVILMHEADTYKVLEKNNDSYFNVGIYHTFENEKFYPPKPYNSWVWNEENNLWESPIGPMPLNEKNYEWDDNMVNWVEQ